MIPVKGGRKTLLQTHNITIDDLRQAYEEVGSYAAVARRYATTRRTVQKYLTGTGERGRPVGSYTSKARRWIEDNIHRLRDADKDVINDAAKDGVSASYMRKVLQSKRERVNTHITQRVRNVIRDNVAILDTRQRYIPTKAIAYVWVPRWKWDRPVYVRVVLRDRTKAKLPTNYTPTPDDVKEV